MHMPAPVSLRYPYCLNMRSGTGIAPVLPGIIDDFGAMLSGPPVVLDTIVPDGLCNALLLIRYPYPTSFYNPVPGYPFKVACEGMLKAGTPLGALRAAADVYYNYSGQAGPCFGSYRMGRRAATLRASRDHDEQDDGPPSGWGYQTCMEVYQPMPTDVVVYPAAGGGMFTPPHAQQDGELGGVLACERRRCCDSARSVPATGCGVLKHCAGGGSAIGSGGAAV